MYAHLTATPVKTLIFTAIPRSSIKPFAENIVCSCLDLYWHTFCSYCLDCARILEKWNHTAGNSRLGPGLDQ